MAGGEAKFTDQTRVEAASAWFQYLEQLDPVRGDLFRYCRKLTGDVFDAEDLAQNTPERGSDRAGFNAA